jgi:hypothetical protein
MRELRLDKKLFTHYKKAGMNFIPAFFCCQNIHSACAIGLPPNLSLVQYRKCWRAKLRSLHRYCKKRNRTHPNNMSWRQSRSGLLVELRPKKYSLAQLFRRGYNKSYSPDECRN